MQPGAFDLPRPAGPKPAGPAHTEQSPEAGFRSIPPTAPMNAGIGAPDMTPKSATSAPVGATPAAAAPAQPALPPWALQGVQSQGANPADFAITSSRTSR